MSRESEVKLPLADHTREISIMSSIVKTDFSPRAQNILLAAQQVLARNGADGLSLRTIAEEALETKSLVLYHFGSMANLEALLVDSLWHDIDIEFVNGLGKLSKNTGLRIDALAGFHARIANIPKLYEMYFDLLPSVIQNIKVRENVARIYEAYRADINDRCLDGCDLPSEYIRPLSVLMLAVGEGVPLHMLLTPQRIDSDFEFALLAELVKSHAGMPALTIEEMVAMENKTQATSKPITLPNPEKGLAKPALRILKAGMRLVHKGGLRALTLDSIAQLSGEPRPSVSYYFINKQGLVESIVALILQRCLAAYKDLFSGSTDVVFSPDVLQRKLFGRASPLSTLLLLLPAILHNKRLLERTRDYYDFLYYNVARKMANLNGSLSINQSIPLASLTIASIDGIAIQKLYDPKGFGSLSSLKTLNSIVSKGLGLPISQ